MEQLGPGRPAPRELAAYVNEPFYAPLSTRLDEGKLTPAELQRLQSYRATKSALQAELRERLAATAELSPAERANLLADFGVVQAPRLAALEAEAEALRRSLIRYTDNWYTFRPWRVGRTRFRNDGTAMRAQIELLKAAVFYQEGLSADQRRLLRELAMEMEDFPRMPISTVEIASDANPLFFFLPATARLRLPASPHPTLAELISRFEADKAAVKQELLTAISEGDDAFLASSRRTRLERLAQQQAPRFSALEALAEQIRRAYAELAPPPAPPDLPDLPPDLTERLATHLEEKVRLEREIVEIVGQIQRSARIDQIGFRRNERNRLEIVVVVPPGRNEAAERAHVAALLEEFNTQHLARIERHAEDFEGIRQSVSWLGGLDPKDRGAVDRRIREFALAYDQRRLWTLYRDYHDAVLTPGLSPAQRRLLYDGALEQLELPLPPGIFQPSGG